MLALRECGFSVLQSPDREFLVRAPSSPSAETLGLEEVVGLLEEALGEEKQTDTALTKLAESTINQYAEAAE